MSAHVGSRELFDEARRVADFEVAATALSSERSSPDLKTRVALAAGAAHSALERSGMAFVQRNPPAAGGGSFSYDPIAGWNLARDPFSDPLLEAIAVAPQIRGALMQKAEEARGVERSLAGRVARLVGFPSSVRRVLADSGASAGLQTAGFVGAVLSQVLGALLAAGLIAAIGHVVGS